MSKRRSEMRQRKREKRERRLTSQGRMVEGVEVPLGAIPAETGKQAPACYSTRFYYKDKEFTCRDCGKVEVWTAQQQKWYFEEVKAHPASEATRCADCRRKRREAREEQRRHMEKLADATKRSET